MTQQGEAPAEKLCRRFTKGHIIALAVIDKQDNTILLTRLG